MTGLIAAMSQMCTRLVLIEEEDASGGCVASWKPANKFVAAVSATGATNPLQIATRPDSQAKCTLTCDPVVELAFHDRVKTSDGRLLLVVSEAKDRHTPVCASFSFVRYECEEVVDA
ncbi:MULTISPECIES: hypothetical protein [Atopobium]|uniref:Uncharacterized protein n=1 Tax=Atopobium minutum 10063974 TaxID=997872 RepID=N2BR05_9ACTN|nr:MULTISPECIES: hypothetical protein [Atopobium]EMZ42706.1 hypothetical protein HMPREF1091_00264 [Atopobium minutum 10063974]ERL15223.1 hypothetical protein HMPREF1247_0791 [Atopobium sp. BV3Ac4]